MSEEGKEQQKENAEFEALTHGLDMEKKRSEEYLTRLQYMQADFENLKKRLDRQMEEVKKYCNESLIVALLDVVDELEAAVKSGRSSESTEAVVQGVEMTLKKLRRVLENEEVFPIESIGKSFDPSKHEAIAKIEKENAEEGEIVEEVRKGYIMKGKVIRPSIVKITIKPLHKQQPETKSNE